MMWQQDRFIMIFIFKIKLYFFFFFIILLRQILQEELHLKLECHNKLKLI